MIAAVTTSASGSFAAGAIEQKPSDLKPCGTYDASALDPRPIPESIGGPGLLASIAKDGFKTPATMLGAPEPLPAVWYNAVKVTPEQAKAICEKHLTAVYLDWSGVPYNLAMRSGAKAVFSALGIKILRFADYSFNPNGMAGVLDCDPAVAAEYPGHRRNGERGPVRGDHQARHRSGRHRYGMEPRLADNEDRPKRAAQSHDHL